MGSMQLTALVIHMWHRWFTEPEIEALKLLDFGCISEINLIDDGNMLFNHVHLPLSFIFGHCGILSVEMSSFAKHLKIMHLLRSNQDQKSNLLLFQFT